MNAAFLGKDAARVNNSLNLLKTLEGQYLNALTSHPAFTTYFPSQVPAPLKQAATDEPMKVSVASDKSQKAGATKKVPSTNNSAANSVAAIKRTRGRPKKIQLAT